MNVYTIGFTKKNAAQFFEMLKSSGAKRIVDVRLNNISQLAGFSKRDDLAYFARTICTIEYVHYLCLRQPKIFLMHTKRTTVIGLSTNNSFCV